MQFVSRCGVIWQIFYKTSLRKAGQKVVAMRCQGELKVEKLLYVHKNLAVCASNYRN